MLRLSWKEQLVRLLQDGGKWVGECGKMVGIRRLGERGGVLLVGCGPIYEAAKKQEFFIMMIFIFSRNHITLFFGLFRLHQFLKTIQNGRYTSYSTPTSSHQYSLFSTHPPSPPSPFSSPSPSNPLQQIMYKKFYIKKEFFVQSSDTKIKDHYEILQIIGRGAFATVYKAKMRYYPYLVRAVKRIKKKFVKNPQDVINQYSILTSFDHPQIIKIYETFEDEENFYIVTDFCEGGELFARLEKQGNFSQNDARSLFTQMVNILKYCHENKTAHRDLKPQNFMLITSKGLDIMLIDFGLCYKWKNNMRAELNKKEGSIIGTAYYMAPEIFTSKYDERCDIWSLGIILFMLVTGEPPVSGTTNQEIFANIKAGHLNLFVLKQQNLNPKLVDLVLRILVPQDQRISLTEIMTHPWMTMKLADLKLNISFQKIRKYSKLSKFKVLVLNYIASQLPQKDIMALGKVFMEIDKNKDGHLTVQELSIYMKTQQSNPNLKEMAQIIQHMDVDHNGRLAYNEFISACLSKSAANNRDYLNYAFRYFDLNKDGKISREELSTVLKAYKKEYSQNQSLIDQLLLECDTNHDNQIDFQQFCKYLIQRNPEQPL